MKKGTIVAILRGITSENAVPIANVLKDQGINWVEVSLSEEEEGLACVRALSDEFGDSLHIGTGTVLNKNMADKAIAAGAKYIITPGWDRELARYVIGKGISMFPGVYSPGDIMQAVSEGMTDVKLFPAGSLGLDYIKNLFGPFPHIRIMAVGGVNKKNVIDFYQAGCHSFAIGSDLVPRGASLDDLDKIKANAKTFIQLLNGSDQNA